MVIGTRYEVANTAKVPIFRLEYQGGDIYTVPSSYVLSIIDSAYWDKNGEVDVLVGCKCGRRSRGRSIIYARLYEGQSK